jgi:hypothetical protein
LLILLATAQFVALAAAFQKPAYAYADPGSGLLFLQVAGPWWQVPSLLFVQNCANCSTVAGSPLKM